MANELPIPEKVGVLYLEHHFDAVDSGWYASRINRITNLDPVAAKVGTSASVVRAMTAGLVEPTFKQWRDLREALRAATAQSGVAS